MLNFKNVIESEFKDCKVCVLGLNKLIGNASQNNFKINYHQDELEIIETLTPDVVIEKFKGEKYKFACALSVSLITHYGPIQFCYLEKQKSQSNINNNHIIEMVVYYSRTNAIDDTTKNQMMFYHFQTNLDLRYLTSTEINEAAKSYLNSDTSNKNNDY